MSRHLTLTEFLLTLLLWGGVGWWFGGRWGAGAGLAAAAVIVARAIWIASQAPDGPEPGDVSGHRDREP